MKEKEFDIKGYGKVMLKKYSFAERCALKGKILTVKINPAGQEDPTLDSEALFFWTVVYSVKSLPNHPDFYKYAQDKKVAIISDLGLGDNEPEDVGERIWKECSEYNQLSPEEIKKK